MKVLQEFKSPSGEVYCTIFLDEPNRCVADIWTGSFGSQDSFKNVLLTITSMVERLKPKHLLTDVSAMAGSFDSSREWVVSEIAPRLIKAGITHQAIVLPKNIFSKLSMSDLFTKTDLARMAKEEIELRYFDARDKGQRWLSEQA